MKIVADENLAFTEYFFADFGDIQQKAGRTLTSQDVQHADVLLVRSVTKVNQALIAGSQLKFVGSATIGTDHLNIADIEQQGIAWSNAAGCNAQAVAEYVITAILKLRPEVLDQGPNFSLGIIGLGNVGSRLASMAKLLGWRVLGFDPFVQLSGIEQVDIQTLLTQANAISIHVPLTQTGEYPTYHLIDEHALQHMQSNAILINSARGPVVKESALIADMQQTQRQVVLDVFEHEPVISAELLALLALATPHIAGYSFEGKARGTQMIYQAFCQNLHIEAIKHFEDVLPSAPPLLKHLDLKTALKQHLTEIYDIQRDDQNLRACLQNGKVDQKAFDHLRKTYPLRREWAAHGGPTA